MVRKRPYRLPGRPENSSSELSCRCATMSINAKLTNYKIRTKILIAFGVMLFLILGVSLAAINRLSAINDRAADIRDNWLVSTGVMGRLLGAAEDVRVYEAR